MLAGMNAESVRQTLSLGETVFWSRSRQEYWHKLGAEVQARLEVGSLPSEVVNYGRY